MDENMQLFLKLLKCQVLYWRSYYILQTLKISFSTTMICISPFNLYLGRLYNIQYFFPTLNLSVSTTILHKARQKLIPRLCEFTVHKFCQKTVPYCHYCIPKFECTKSGFLNVESLLFINSKMCIYKLSPNIYIFDFSNYRFTYPSV